MSEWRGRCELGGAEIGVHLLGTLEKAPDTLYIPTSIDWLASESDMKGPLDVQSMMDRLQSRVTPSKTE